MELSKFSISEIKENIKKCELLNENYYDLYHVYNLLTSMDNTFVLPNVKLLDFYNHQQFIINIFGVKKRIFYKKNEESDISMKQKNLNGGGNPIESLIDVNNTMIYIFNTQLVNKGRVRLNKKYGTIYSNLEESVSDKLKDIENMELTQIDNESLDFNKIYKLNYGSLSTEIYIMSVKNLEMIFENTNSDIIMEPGIDEIKLEDANNIAELKISEFDTTFIDDFSINKNVNDILKKLKENIEKYFRTKKEKYIKEKERQNREQLAEEEQKRNEINKEQKEIRNRLEEKKKLKMEQDKKEKKKQNNINIKILQKLRNKIIKIIKEKKFIIELKINQIKFFTRNNQLNENDKGLFEKYKNFNVNNNSVKLDDIINELNGIIDRNLNYN